MKVCERCDPERYQRKCRARWWRREKCRPKLQFVHLDHPCGPFVEIGSPEYREWERRHSIPVIDGEIVTRRALRALDRLRVSGADETEEQG